MSVLGYTSVKPISTLHGIDGKGFEVVADDDNSAKIVFGENGINVPRRNKFNQAFEIGNIRAVQSGRTQENFLLTLKGEDDGRFVFDDADRLIAGRTTAIGPLGTSSDVYMAVDRKDYERWAEEVKRSGSGEEFIDRMMESDFSLNFEVYSPEMLRGVGSVKTGRVLEKQRDEVIKRVETELRELKVLFGQLKIKEEQITGITEVIRKTFDSVEKVEIGKVSVSFNNNGNNAPSLVISIPGQETKTIPLQGVQRDLSKILLEGSLRAPDYGLSQLSKTISETTKPFRTSSGIPYGTAPHLKALWNQNIGRNTRIGGFWGTAGYFWKSADKVLVPNKYYQDIFYVPYGT